MLNNKDVIRLKHMLDAAVKIQDFLKSKNLADFRSDEQLELAIIRLLEIMGEAANQISDELRNRHPEIPWKQIVSVRNRLIHAYFDIDENIIWNILINDLPIIIPALQKLLLSLDNNSLI